MVLLWLSSFFVVLSPLRVVLLATPPLVGSTSPLLFGGAVHLPFWAVRPSSLASRWLVVVTLLSSLFLVEFFLGGKNQITGSPQVHRCELVSCYVSRYSHTSKDIFNSYLQQT